MFLKWVLCVFIFFFSRTGTIQPSIKFIATSQNVLTLFNNFKALHICCDFSNRVFFVIWTKNTLRMKFECTFCFLSSNEIPTVFFLYANHTIFYGNAYFCLSYVKLKLHWGRKAKKKHKVEIQNTYGLDWIVRWMLHCIWVVFSMFRWFHCVFYVYFDNAENIFH